MVWMLDSPADCREYPFGQYDDRYFKQEVFCKVTGELTEVIYWEPVILHGETRRQRIDKPED